MKPHKKGRVPLKALFFFGKTLFAGATKDKGGKGRLPKRKELEQGPQGVSSFNGFVCWVLRLSAYRKHGCHWKRVSHSDGDCFAG